MGALKLKIGIKKIQQLVGQILWGQNVVIISKSIEEALFYASKTIENNWFSSVLTHKIELDFLVEKVRQQQTTYRFKNK